MTIRATNQFMSIARAGVDTSIPDRFAAQVRQHPGRLAVKCREDTLTYQELDQITDQVAGLLLQRGAGPQTRVALLLDQGVELVASIVGVVKAGCIYVPLEARFPQRQLESLLHDAEADYLVTDSANIALAAQLADVGCNIVHFDQVRAAALSPHRGVRCRPDMLAYIYYTSGSTGEPKGVTDSHRNVLHNVMRYTNGLRIKYQDRLSLIQSCGFSGCVSSLFGALLNGAVLSLFDLQLDGAHRLAEWVQQEGITIYHSVPVLFRQLVSSGRRFDTVRLVRLEGDQADWRDVERFRAHFPSSSLLVNGLGTTETGIARRFFVDQQTPLSTGPLPIGFPVEDMEVALTDDSGHELGPGEIGEIVVRSEYLAVGYWRRSDLTAAAFREPDTNDGTRAYRTGDLGRMDADGCLEYIGRKDLQTKIRGAWADAPAVERALLETGMFGEALAMTREDPHGDPQLVAYLVPTVSPVPSVGSIREALAEALPAAAMPTAYVMLDALPLSAQGKIDRRALPLPAPTRQHLDSHYSAPATPVEQLVAAIWTEVLGVETVGVQDNFFDLGGQSLLASQVLSRLESELGLGLSLRCFFEAPTLAELSLTVVERLTSRAGGSESHRMLDEEQP